jgi:hypothetical protein
VGQNFKFFVAPDELQAVLTELSRSAGATLWQEGSAHGRVDAVASLRSASERILWFGPGPVVEWNAREAAYDAGFIGVVVPHVNEEERTLFLGEIFTAVSRGERVQSLFPKVKRRVEGLLKHKLIPVSDTSGDRGNRGPRASDKALTMLNAGYKLKMFEAPLVHYAEAGT